jgi:DNA modification methylase
MPLDTSTLNMTNLHLGDCRKVMRTLEPNSVDSIVTDPPYGLSFMGKGWDHGVPGVEFWVEALRAAKPGAHLLAFGGTRTFHRLAVAIEDAGWEIRDTVMWVYGSGFPKSHDVSKAIDKAAGAEREVVGKYCSPESTSGGKGRKFCHSGQPLDGLPDITAPATDAARQWSGWGTALKPAWEPVIVARKPLVGTVAENFLRHGTGGINVDGCRVETDELLGRMNNSTNTFNHKNTTPWVNNSTNKGRWPANVIHDGSDEVMRLFPVTHAPGSNGSKGTKGKGYVGDFGLRAVPQLPSYTDSGSAARFFYCAKTSKADRDEGCEELGERTAGECTDRKNGSAGMNSPRAGAGRTSGSRNHHPTVKPTALMRYLCRLVTPPNGLILDPFMGSGSTGKAAILEGYRFIGIDLEPEYHQIATARIQHVINTTAPLFTPEP